MLKSKVFSNYYQQHLHLKQVLHKIRPVHYCVVCLFTFLGQKFFLKNQMGEQISFFTFFIVHCSHCLFQVSWPTFFVVKPDGRTDLFAFQITGGNNLSSRQTAYNFAFLRHLTFFLLFILHTLYFKLQTSYVIHYISYFIFHHNWTRASSVCPFTNT